MRYSDFTQRIAGDGAAAWDIHYRALARVEQGEEILLLSVGDPDFDTPAPIVQAAIDSLLAGNTHYADVRGKRALRQRIAERHRRRSGQAVDAEQVVVLAGAQCALYAVVQGASLPRATWEALAELCMAHDLWMISDEVYSELLFDGEHVSPASLPGMADRTATLNSLSKSHAMTGWRVGWVVGPAALCAHLENLALCMLYGSPEFIQDAACTALEAPLPELEAMREAYRRRRDLVIECLADSPGLRPLRPDGGMFVMVDIRPTGLSAQAFADRLLDRHGVSVLAGEAFGPSAAGHIRLGLVLGAEPLREACRRIALCAAELLGQA
ncbi:pyridoxal phosphate-dependent aminotransferase [Pseudomonas aeruginosa]|uniref:pyridoxal phosphate-dependent aminotransferase n=1 Tax=Pseudomonas aeruginosa TaxID=287 RepID=UPI0010518334|nr:pyridoxal phosphate-dependent aminotransferase [Pseudomonas aeruginosa]